MPKKDIVHIFYACDDNFVKYTAVSLFSMMENASSDRDYHIHILHTDITEQMQSAVLNMARGNFVITFEDVSEHLNSLCATLPLRDY